LLTGPVTALPLLLYGAAARRVPLTTLGVLMYLAPTLQFLWGVLVIGEPMPVERWVGFALVWLALVIFTVDLFRSARVVGLPSASRRSSEAVSSGSR
jgi:chloramphenicol-sensitive protein RarD